MKRKKPEKAFFGSSLVSAYWNGAATYYRFAYHTYEKRALLLNRIFSEQEVTYQ